MNSEEHLLEAAQAAVQAQQDRAIAAVQAAILAEGSEDCEDCGEPISEARRAALPSAVRCIGCQTKFERGQRGY